MVNRHISTLRIWLGFVVALAVAAWVTFVQGRWSDGAFLGAILAFVVAISLSSGQFYDKWQRSICYPLSVYVVRYAFASIASLSLHSGSKATKLH